MHENVKFVASDCKDHDVLRSQLQGLLPQERPLVLMGAGRAAEGVPAALEKWGLKISDVCVSDAYWRSGSRHDGYDVLNFSQVCDKYDSFDVVIAVVTNWECIREQLLSTGKVVHCVFWGHTRAEARFTWPMIEEHAPALNAFYDILADDYSRTVMRASFESRLANDKSILDAVDVPGEDQYFSPLVKISSSEVFVDCGAFNGDTFKVFLTHATDGFKKYVAFECDPENFKSLAASSNDSRLVCIPKGVASEPGSFEMNASGCSSAALQSGGGTRVDLTAIDSEAECVDASFIKMDIEGAELSALKGAAAVIARNHPKLAICIYHKAEDFWTIPQYIHSLYAGYKLYLRHYPSTVTDEIVLYAIP